MAVNLKNVKDTVNLAAEVLGAAAAVIEGAKQLGVDVDAVGGAVKDAAGGAANGARVVADGIGKGFGAAADGVGAAVGALAIVIHALITGDWVGALMNLVAALLFILPAAILYKKMHTYKGAIIGLILGVVLATLGSIVANLTIGVWFWYGSADVILPLMIPAVIPFNLLKTILNSVLTLVVYKAVSNLITPKKKQVKGRVSE